MSTFNDNILEKGYWDEIKPDARVSSHAAAAKWGVSLVRPSFMTKKGGPHKPLSRTAYLDGLRGFAAFMVYWLHHQLWASESVNGDSVFQNGFGYDHKYYFVALPGIRTFFSGGHFAVTVFFVISGYVLSAKPLTFIHAGEYVKLGDNLASALFKRWLRLHIPVICVTFLYMTSWHVFGLQTGVEHQGTYREEVWKWYCEFKNFTFVFKAGNEPWTYNYHIWSIPVEFRGSVVIYTALLAFSRCRRNARLWCEVGLIFYFMYIADAWYCSLFTAGMLLCDLDLLAANDELPRFFSRLEPFKEFIYYHLFVISIYLGGVPSFNNDIEVLRKTRGWYYLSFLKPQAFLDYKWFYLFWASTFLVASIPRIPWLRNFFELPFNQYLGRISFAFYLVHGPILSTLGDRLYAATGWSKVSHPILIPDWINIFPLSKAGPVGVNLAFLAPHLIILPTTLWLAEIATRVFDQPSVKFAQWAYKKTLAPSVKL